MFKKSDNSEDKSPKNDTKDLAAKVTAVADQPSSAEAKTVAPEIVTPSDDARKS